MSETPIKDVLFKGLEGCGDNSCYVKRPEGMATNGGCRCIHNRSLQNILWSRAAQIDAYFKECHNPSIGE